MTHKSCLGLQMTFCLKVTLYRNKDYMKLHLMNTEPKFLDGILFKGKIMLTLTFTLQK
jgi:hypothetical protein